MFVLLILTSKQLKMTYLEHYKIGQLVQFTLNKKQTFGKIITIGENSLNVQCNKKYYFLVKKYHYSNIWIAKNEINSSTINKR
jgi:hypothetical protein